MPTIGLKSPISPHDSTNDRCEGSNPPVKHNDSCRFTESFRISSGSDVTCYGQLPIGSCETAPSRFGKKQPAHTKAQFLSRNRSILILSMLKLTMPSSAHVQPFAAEYHTWRLSGEDGFSGRIPRSSVKPCIHLHRYHRQMAVLHVFMTRLNLLTIRQSWGQDRDAFLATDR